jgi:hypothetical protein
MRDDGPGTYTVIWHNVSSDDRDPNDGSFLFTVAGPAPVAAPAPGPAAHPRQMPRQLPRRRRRHPSSLACVDHGVIMPGIADVRVNTYCKRQAIRDQHKGKMNELVFNP